jgi:hypothetical protein
MDIFSKMFEKLDALPEESLKKGLVLFCSALLLGAFLCVYKTRYDQLILVDQAKKAIANVNKINTLLVRKAQIDQEKDAVAKLAENQTNKDLLKLIESSAKDLEIDLDESYKTSFKIVPIPQEADFVEQQTTITTDKLNLKKIITLINSLRNESFVMFRELTIENKGKTPSCQFSLSMRQKK